MVEQRSANPIGAALDLNVDRGPAGHPLVGIETAGDQADGLDGFDAWAVCLDALKVLIELGDAVKPDDGIAGRLPIDIDRHRPGGIIAAARLDVVGLRNPGHHRSSGLPGASAGRHGDQLRARGVRLDGGGFGLQGY